MREMHFWLHNHPLGRQRGWVLAVGVDWSLELYCKTREAPKQKAPAGFIPLQQIALWIQAIDSSKTLECSAASSTPPPGTAHAAYQARRCDVLPAQELPVPSTKQHNAGGISPPNGGVNSKPILAPVP